jgi:hypothetical protein
MPSHDVEVKLPAGTAILSADATISVFADEELLGTLKVSRGSIDWRPRHGKKVRRLSWEQFDRLMRDTGTAV